MVRASGRWSGDDVRVGGADGADFVGEVELCIVVELCVVGDFGPGGEPEVGVGGLAIVDDADGAVEEAHDAEDLFFAAVLGRSFAVAEAPDASVED